MITEAAAHCNQRLIDCVSLLNSLHCNAAAAYSINAGTDNDLGGDAIYPDYLAGALSSGECSNFNLDII